VAALQEAGQKNPVIFPDDERSPQENRDACNRLKVSASTELICRLVILSPEVRHWLTTQTAPSLSHLDPELSLVEELLNHLKGLQENTPSALLSCLPPDIQMLVSGWNLEKIPNDPLAAAQKFLRGLRLNDLKKRETAIKLELEKPGLSLSQILSVNKEILDLKARIDDLSTPAT
jgi:hypothetical protein